MWLAYCYFHNGDYKKAIDAYDDAMRKAGWMLREGQTSHAGWALGGRSISFSCQENDSNIYAYKACCYYALCQYQVGASELGIERLRAMRHLTALAGGKPMPRRPRMKQQKLQIVSSGASSGGVSRCLPPESGIHEALGGSLFAVLF